MGYCQVNLPFLYEENIVSPMQMIDYSECNKLLNPVAFSTQKKIEGMSHSKGFKIEQVEQRQ